MSVEEEFRIARIETWEMTDASIQYADNLQVSVTLHFCFMKIQQQLMPPLGTNTHPYAIQHFEIHPTVKLIPFTFVFKVSPHSCEMLTCDASNALSPVADIPNEFERILGLGWHDVYHQIRNTVFQHKPKRIQVFLEALITVEVDTQVAAARSANSSAIIASLETKEFEKDSEEDSSECSICLVEFSKGEKVTNTPCSHMFHTKCLTNWFNRRHNCPLSRFQIEDAQHQ